MTDLRLELLRLRKQLWRASLELKEGITSESFDIWDFEFLAELFESRKKPETVELFKTSDFFEAVRKAEHPTILGREVLKRMARLRRMTTKLFHGVPRDFSFNDVKLFEEVLGNWRVRLAEMTQRREQPPAEPA
jgi:hypothetical protein